MTVIGSSWRVASRLVERSGPVSVAAEVLMLAAAAATPFFFASVVLKPTVDAALFYSRASFVTMSQAPLMRGDAQSVLVLPEFPVVGAPGPGGSLAYTPHLATVEVDLVPDVRAFGREVLGANLVSSAAGDGAVIDIDTAMSLGVGLGSRILLDLPAIGGSEAPQARVIGIMQPYAKVGESRSTGLVVFPSGSVSPTFTADAATLLSAGAKPLARLYDVADASAKRRDDITAAFLAEFLNADLLAAAGGVALFGSILWLAVSARVVGRAKRRANRSIAILVALGALRSRVVFAALALPGLQMAAGCMGGAGLVVLMIYPAVLRRVVQGPTFLPLLALYLVLGIGFLVFEGTRIHRALGSGGLVEMLTRDQE